MVDPHSIKEWITLRSECRRVSNVPQDADQWRTIVATRAYAMEPDHFPRKQGHRDTISIVQRTPDHGEGTIHLDLFKIKMDHAIMIAGCKRGGIHSNDQCEDKVNDEPWVYAEHCNGRLPLWVGTPHNDHTAKKVCTRSNLRWACRALRSNTGCPSQPP